MTTEYKKLKKIVGGWAFRALVHGRPLCRERMYTPNNWFIENAKGDAFLWTPDENRGMPPLDLFEAREHSEETVPPYCGPDSEQPRETKYFLKDSV